MTYAIPTKWSGVQFRSRLEARWAAFFTAIGWSWSYEPFDLPGYIPDFILHMHQDVLVEVKPFTRLDDDVIAAAHEKITESGWNDEERDGIPARDSIVVGARIFDSEQVHVSGALLIGAMACGDFAVLGTCCLCSRVTFASSLMSYHCRVCGEHMGGALPSFDIEDRKRVFGAWNEAGNTVQWRGRR